MKPWEETTIGCASGVVSSGCQTITSSPGRIESLSSAARPTPPKRTTLIAVDVKCPVLALYGGADQSIPQELIEKRQAALQGGRQDL
jgi:dienelactone hydrolase